MGNFLLLRHSWSNAEFFGERGGNRSAAVVNSARDARDTAINNMKGSYLIADIHDQPGRSGRIVKKGTNERESFDFERLKIELKRAHNLEIPFDNILGSGRDENGNAVTGRCRRRSGYIRFRRRFRHF